MYFEFNLLIYFYRRMQPCSNALQCEQQSLTSRWRCKNWCPSGLRRSPSSSLIQLSACFAFLPSALSLLIWRTWLSHRDSITHGKPTQCMCLCICFLMWFSSTLGYMTFFRYEDFVDGDRVKRIYAALRTGLSALTCVLFFDSINRDKKGTIRHVSFNV